MRKIKTAILIKLPRHKLQAFSAITLLLLSLIVGISTQLKVNAVTTSTSTEPTFITSWGATGTGNGEFQGAEDVATDAEGNVYVADTYAHRIQKFTSDGTFVTKWGSAGTGDGQFSNSRGVKSVVVDSDGFVYTSDPGNFRIQKFTSDGTFVTKWGSQGSGNGQFQDVSSLGKIAVDANNIYAADTNGNFRIQKFTSDGTFVTKWGSGGVGNGQFTNIKAVAVDKDGFIYAVDETSVQKFTSDGTFVTRWGSAGPTADGIMNLPNDIVASEDGSIYVSDLSLNRIQKFTNTGTFQTKWRGGGGSDDFSSLTGIGSGADGSIYTIEYGQSDAKVKRFRFQQNTATLLMPSSSSMLYLNLPAGNHITAHSAAAPTTQDSGFEYPFGLVHFTFNTTTAGASVPVELIFETVLTADEVTPRKFNTTTGMYANITGVSVSETTVDGGRPALKLTYTVIDGGILDEDTEENGVIIDPVGLAVLAATSSTPPSIQNPVNPNTPTAPNSGLPQQNMWVVLASLSLGIGILVLSQVKPIRRAYAKTKK